MVQSLPPPHMEEGRPRRRLAAMVDRISTLPDDLLLSILLRIGSTRAAVRTSVLSRRWRHLWRRLPELRLGTSEGLRWKATLLDSVEAALDSVDAALDASSAPALQRLEVTVHCYGPRVQAGRVAPWLRFASQRRVGELYIEVTPETRFFSPRVPVWDWQADLPVWDAELELAVWEEATRITLSLEPRWWIHLCPSGSFMSLTHLRISSATMEGSELGTLVSDLCPLLKNLYLVVRLVTVSNVSIRSNSLDFLSLNIENAQKLQVIAPKLEVLAVCDATEAQIAASKLAEVSWGGDTGYDPQCHSFANAGSHLRLLDLGSKCVGAALMRRFNRVDVLKLRLNLYDFEGTEAYTTFLNETKALPKCEKLRLKVLLRNYYHIFTSSNVIFHLLRSCNSTRKVSITVDSGAWKTYTCSVSCHCRLAESCKADGISLESLEEVKITFLRHSFRQLQFVEELARCHAPSLKKVVIKYDVLNLKGGSQTTKDVQEKVSRMFDPDVIVKCNGLNY